MLTYTQFQHYFDSIKDIDSKISEVDKAIGVYINEGPFGFFLENMMTLLCRSTVPQDTDEETLNEIASLLWDIIYSGYPQALKNIDNTQDVLYLNNLADVYDLLTQAKKS